MQAARGMNDVLPAEIGYWQRLEETARDLLSTYGYAELRVPVVEHTELFARAIGEHTDVVEKEMFTFIDRGGESLTLRPEATAGVARALIANGMLRGQRHKLWTSGPMFRHEKPQKGRYRQFYQIDVEAIGYSGPDVDAELIALSARLWRRLGISRVRLEINSLGTPASRARYREHLVEYFRAHESRLDADSQRRLETNPLRILDSKNPEMQSLIGNAPLLTEHLDHESREHFESVRAQLESMGIGYQVNPRLVRGLDYYNGTVFEWLTDALGSQGAVCSGGRYDGLIGQLGGEPTPGIGFAMGEERLVELLRLASPGEVARGADVYVVLNGARAEAQGLGIVEQLRDALPECRIETHLGGGNFKAQFRRADRSGAALALILGDDELARGVAALKPLRGESGQSECPLAELPSRLAAELAGTSRR
ncbi:MAG TPA: histidine--tRNA ligase [Steroidobacteraceae bacterium]|nr:histidine--tRNA ligase [Steroidobacteraceae bacterium]